MKLIIDIDEELYHDAIKLVEYGYTLPNIVPIANGKPYEERPEGKWITCNSLTSDKELLDENEYYLCPFCHSKFRQKHDFCVCGADMRGGKE